MCLWVGFTLLQNYHPRRDAGDTGGDYGGDVDAQLQMQLQMQQMELQRQRQMGLQQAQVYGRNTSMYQVQTVDVDSTSTSSSSLWGADSCVRHRMKKIVCTAAKRNLLQQELLAVTEHPHERGASTDQVCIRSMCSVIVVG